MSDQIVSTTTSVSACPLVRLTCTPSLHGVRGGLRTLQSDLLHTLNFRFEEVRARYERRESRQEDLNTISDLRQVMAEQEKDLACINEEKRYFQMKLIQLEQFLQHQGIIEPEDPAQPEACDSSSESAASSFNQGASFNIPPTIPECDDC